MQGKEISFFNSFLLTNLKNSILKFPNPLKKKKTTIKLHVHGMVSRQKSNFFREMTENQSKQGNYV